MKSKTNLIPPALKKKLEDARDKMAKKKIELPKVEQGTVKEQQKHTKKAWWRRGILSRWQRRKLMVHPETSFLIRMFFSNGTSKEFVISTNKETFDYMGRTYYLRYEDSWFNITHSQYELNYFDDYPVPIDRKIIREGDKNFWTVTPENLKNLIKMEYVKALASSQELNKFLRMNATLSVLIVFMMMIVLYFTWKASKILTFLATK